MRPILTSVSAFALASALFALPASAVTNLLVNGDFESVGSPGEYPANSASGGGYDLDELSGSRWSVYDKIPGWTAVSGRGIEVQSPGTIPLTPHSGTKYVELDSDPAGGSNSAMEQTVSGLLIGGLYEFSFWYSPRTSDPLSNVIGWDFTPPGGIGSTVTGPGGSLGTVVGQWTQVFDTFVAADDTVTIKLYASGTENKLGGFIDDVSLSLVPLPAGALLIVGAFAGAAAFRRFGRA